VPAERYDVDTSAYLCLLLSEAGWQQLASELDGAQLLSSALLALEAERTLVHLSRAGRLTPAELQNALLHDPRAIGALLAAASQPSDSPDRSPPI
jgi:uncharacterized protein with PIN domain